MKFTLDSEGDGPTCISCSGRITQSTFDPNINPLQELLGDSGYSRPVLLDMHKTEYIDSSGIGWLVATHKQCLRNGGELILHSLPPMVNQVVQLLRMDKMLNIQPDLTLAQDLAIHREKDA